ncbi:putative peroxisomal proliferator-activated receptor a-interacting complex 285 kda protein [Lasiodiplodia theobromae]|nr:putative peroxisomal proliferator-activated receptor a-interacting complex 285 kda protein [Lasiodiplodia theobromae]
MDVDPLPPPLLASPPAGPAQQEAEKAQEEIAAGAQEISMAIASSQIVDLKDFPNDFKSVKESPGYPKFAGHLNMEQAVQEHRGRDQKPFLIKTSKRGKRGNQKAQVFSHTPAVVAFSNATRSNVFGKISTQLPLESLITVAYFPSTQTPSIHLKLLHAKSKHRHVLIEAFIYGNSIEMSQDPEQNASLHSLEMDVGPSLKTEYISPKVLNDESTGVAAAHSAGELWLTCIDINPSRPTDRPEEEQPGLSSSRLAALPFEDDIVTDDQSPEMIQSMSTERDSGIKFFGIAAKDLKHIRETTERDFETGLNDVEKIIWWLAQPSFQMHIYSWTPSESVDTAKEFIKYFRPLMKISMDHGPYWFYRLEAQSTKKFSDRDFPYKSLPVPRWLVNRWQIGLNEDNIPIPGTEIPLHWTNFRLPTEAPSSDAKMFQYQLAVTREREEHQRRIRESRLETDFNIVTKFKKFSGQPNKFLVAIWLKGHDPMATPSKLPSLESRISISVRIGKKDVVFNGMTCEDFFNVRCHIFACVRGVGNTSALKEDIRYRGFITLVDDEVPTSRILNGLYLCAQPKKANKGVDVGALLGFHEPMITHADCLAQEFGQKKEMCNRFQTVMSRIQLDKNQ